MIYRLIHDDVLAGLARLESESVQCVVTSPPYWGLRDYGVAGQLGLERTPDEYVARMVAVFAEVRRVLRADGTLWLNIGDSYGGSGKGRDADGTWNPGAGGSKQATNVGSTVGDTARIAAVSNTSRRFCAEAGMKPKDLIGIPWRLAFGLQADGWYLRSDIIWSKPNPMPESVTDRPTKAHEYLFLLSKSARYFYDADAIAEIAVMPSGSKAGYAGYSERAAAMGREASGNERDGVVAFNDGRRNKRSVWHVPTEPFHEAHFATFPTALVEPCILAGSRVGDTVLDPFNGSGTTGIVALGHQRNYIGIDLNADYIAMARRRLQEVAPMFAKEQTA